MLRGWIAPGPDSFPRYRYDPEAARKKLEALGVVVGRWNGNSCEFEGCEVSPATLKLLDPYWGEFIWGLR